MTNAEGKDAIKWTIERESEERLHKQMKEVKSGVKTYLKGRKKEWKGAEDIKLREKLAGN